MNIKEIKNNVMFDKFFLFIKENNFSIEDGLLLLSNKYQVENSNILNIFPELISFCTYTSNLETFLFNFFDNISFLKLKQLNYKFLNKFLQYISQFALTDKKILLFVVKFKNLSDIEYKIIFNTYSELIHLNNEDEFHYLFWKYVLKYQNLNLKFINKFQDKFKNPEFALLVSFQKEFWNLNQNLVSKILKIRSN